MFLIGVKLLRHKTCAMLASNSSFDVENLYELAPILFGAVGVIITMLIGMPVSAISRELALCI